MSGNRATRRERRETRDRLAVFGFLQGNGESYVLDIWNALAIRPGGIYVALRELEREGAVVRSHYSASGRVSYRVSA